MKTNKRTEPSPDQPQAPHIGALPRPRQSSAISCASARHGNNPGERPTVSNGPVSDENRAETKIRRQITGTGKA
jgi:hypothetical protein